jgi:hypothetical protein
MTATAKRRRRQAQLRKRSKKDTTSNKPISTGNKKK